MGQRGHAEGTQESLGQGEQQTRCVWGWRNGRQRCPRTRRDASSILQLQRAPGGDQPPTLAPAGSGFIFPNLKQRQKIACLLRSLKDFTEGTAPGTGTRCPVVKHRHGTRGQDGQGRLLSSRRV